LAPLRGSPDGLARPVAALLRQLHLAVAAGGVHLLSMAFQEDAICDNSGGGNRGGIGD
jgi:hypothetical protein